ncbi:MULTISPECIES: hypothetical protein [unclassified Paenibacillus]|uniref:hypothetical protein n=1 Tax=unclassified Paenibacillus TaxID=185978 RepID=UPI002404D3F8|nr:MULTISPECIES: hypothetical protein [unclassified Paenibacillus]MDF9840623.1 hypothetical protein [Paenibacillus sp. PastF-2]MDF9847205.1 hypothetical protein [Paenibacillus sp. PastM-2]MDF9853777.1 hypothetical protein [Paenibacillus sp. PastF-1]MDH6478737.1 hypothetical protein [Paenibacillus sp. PastH-2]MDH6506469.1 hypothetical protein [Paenibacillus sp. PastM-3]
MAKHTAKSQRSSVVYSVYVRNHSEEGSFRAVERDLGRIRQQSKTCAAARQAESPDNSSESPHCAYRPAAGKPCSPEAFTPTIKVRLTHPLGPASAKGMKIYFRYLNR